jgi:predicted SPOUT superfamily RNA methylase MTH1
MRTIETTVQVGDDRTLVVQLPSDVAPGEHRVVVIIEDSQAAPAKAEPLRFSGYDVGLVDPDFTFRREDLYGDDGR